MAFGKKQSIMLYLTDKTLRVYQGDEQLKTVELTLEAKEDKQKTLKKLLQTEVGSLLSKQDILIVIGGGLLFQKSISVAQETVGEAEKEAFYSELSLPKEDQARKVITTEHKVYLLATDKNYYQALMDVCSEQDSDVSHVLPLSLFSDDTDTDELTREQRSDILKNKSLYELGDFLTDNSYTPEKSTPEVAFVPQEQIVVRESSFNPAGLFKLLAISLLLAGIFFAGFVFMDKNMGKTPADDAQKEATTPTPTPLVEVVAKEDLTVQILNGTGTAGQAGKVEDLLLKAGFANIETGNAEEQDNEATEVVVSEEVSKEVQTELKKELETLFGEVSVTSSSEEVDFDIVITTGTELE